MALDFRCPQCGKTYQAPDHLAGKTIKCRDCGAHVPVPAAAAPVRSPKAQPGQPAARGATGAAATPNRQLAARPPAQPKAPLSRPASPPPSRPQPQFAAPPAYNPPAPRQPAGIPDLNAAALAAPLGAALRPQSSLPGGGNEPIMLIAECFVGLLLLVSGGGMYWAYAAVTYVPTSAERSQRQFEQAKDRMDAQRLERIGHAQTSAPAPVRSQEEYEARAAEIRAETEARQQEYRDRFMEQQAARQRANEEAAQRAAEQRAAQQQAAEERAAQQNQGNADSGRDSRFGPRGPNFRPPRFGPHFD